tara:strand:+ start:251 stop:718 length:468 start_codon:yes stop_codon:yes gene_type:complete
MKNRYLFAVAVVLIGVATLFSFKNVESEDEKAIKELIESAYVNGAFNGLNSDAMEAAFHPDFAIFSSKGEELSRYEIGEWVGSVRKRKNDPKFDPANNVWDHKFGFIDVTGQAASLKLEYHRKGELVYTDYISLIKFESGWKIVAKVYEYHGKKK